MEVRNGDRFYSRDNKLYTHKEIIKMFVEEKEQAMRARPFNEFLERLNLVQTDLDYLKPDIRKIFEKDIYEFWVFRQWYSYFFNEYIFMAE